MNRLTVYGLAIAVMVANGAYLATRDVPVEQKVVELHMRTKPVPGQSESKAKHPKKAELMPLGGGTCSGSFIDDNGDILTARHCVQGFDEFEAMTFDRRRYTASVVAVSDTHDLAMLHIDRKNTPFFRLAGNVTRGQAVFVLGSPLGITDTLSTGVIARLDGDITLLDCSALPGNSGGPVFDKNQKMIGVLTAGYVVMYGVTHLNVSQGLDAVRFFVRAYGRSN